IPKGREGTYINLFSMSGFLGMGCGPFIAGTLTEYFYMNATFYAMTGLSILALFLLLVFVPPVSSPSKLSGKSRRVPLLTIARDNRVKGVFIFTASRAFWRQGIIAFLSIFTASTMRMSEAGIGLLLSAYLVTGGIAQGFVGLLVDRCNKIALLIIFSIIGPALIFLIPFIHSGKTLLAILIPLAMMGAIARGSALAINVEVGKQYQAMGTIMGTFSSGQSLGMVIGPVTFGYIMNLFCVNWTFEVGVAEGIIGGFITAYYLLHR
ncbi:MFS transporter, partial [Candidatus Omnitrophota bacterium]